MNPPLLLFVYVPLLLFAVFYEYTNPLPALFAVRTTTTIRYFFSCRYASSTTNTAHTRTRVGTLFFSAVPQSSDLLFLAVYVQARSIYSAYSLRMCVYASATFSAFSLRTSGGVRARVGGLVVVEPRGLRYRPRRADSLHRSHLRQDRVLVQLQVRR